jgi:hypothetical protein
LRRIFEIALLALFAALVVGASQSAVSEEVQAAPAVRALNTTFTNCVPQSTPSTISCRGATSIPIFAGNTLRLMLASAGAIVAAGPLAGCPPVSITPPPTPALVTYGPCGAAVPAGTEIQLTFDLPAGVVSVVVNALYGGSEVDVAGQCANVTNTRSSAAALTTNCSNVTNTVVGSGGQVALGIFCVDGSLPGICTVVASSATAGTCPRTTSLPLDFGGSPGAGPALVGYTCGPDQSAPAGTLISAVVSHLVPSSATTATASGCPLGFQWCPTEMTGQFPLAGTDTWTFPLTVHPINVQPPTCIHVATPIASETVGGPIAPIVGIRLPGLTVCGTTKSLGSRSRRPTDNLS